MSFLGLLVALVLLLFIHHTLSRVNFTLRRIHSCQEITATSADLGARRLHPSQATLKLRSGAWKAGEEALKYG